MMLAVNFVRISDWRFTKEENDSIPFHSMLEAI